MPSNAWLRQVVANGLMSIGAHATLCWKYKYNKYMFNVIDIYCVIHVIGCVGRGSSALLCPGGL